MLPEIEFIRKELLVAELLWVCSILVLDLSRWVTSGIGFDSN